MTTAEFIEKCTAINGDAYDYGKVHYKNRCVKVIVTCMCCKTEYSIRPISLLEKRKCKWCVAKRRASEAEATKAAKVLHKEKLTGVITRPAQQAPKKRQYRYKKNGRWCTSDWQKAGERSQYFNAFAVYVIRCSDDGTDEQFIKIGKTFLTVQRRMVQLPYRWELLAYVSGSADEISKLERDMHKMYQQYKYWPAKSFGGQTECFTLALLDNVHVDS